MEAAVRPAKTSNQKLIEALDKALERVEKHKDKILNAKAILSANGDVPMIELIEALAECGIIQSPFGIHINGVTEEDVKRDEKTS